MFTRLQGGTTCVTSGGSRGEIEGCIPTEGGDLNVCRLKRKVDSDIAEATC